MGSAEGARVGTRVRGAVGRAVTRSIQVAVGTGVASSASSLTERMFRETMGTYSRKRREPKTRTPIRTRGRICT